MTEIAIKKGFGFNELEFWDLFDICSLSFGTS